MISYFNESIYLIYRLKKIQKMIRIAFTLLFFALVQLNNVVPQRYDLNSLASVGNCKFYNKMEKIKKCGPTGYLISYGFYFYNLKSMFEFDHSNNSFKLNRS